ncbi:MAG TPA: restriction endonuclease subunit S [Rhodoferax sp.]|jgi:type I restriction enzyme S subunit|nr:restriction endonuclease subunit S [Rhodoferax sp.]HQY76204.1 restriction endonuclease subunit S [Rhodoferax sp.]
MSAEIRPTLLGDLLEITSSKRIHMADYVPSGIPFYRSKEVIERAKGNNISTELFISHKQFDLIKQKFGSPRDGDILLTSVGTLGVPYVVRGDGDFYFKDGNLTWMRNFSKEISPQFLYYWLTSPQIQQKLDEVSIGSTQKALTISALKALQIPLPTRATQDGIVEILGAISDRITLLRETNATLEAIAQALFKSWFVDFDPVRAKLEGRAPEGMDEATAALFPDCLEESELGLVPKGWRVATLADTFDINPTRKLSKGAMASYLDMASLATSGHCVEAPIDREVGSGAKFQNGDTLLARITPCLENGKSAFVDFLAEGEIGWGSTEFLVLRPKAPLPQYLGYLLCRHPAFREYAIQSMSGTSGRQRIQNDVLGRYLLAVPDVEIAVVFADVIGPIQRSIAANHQSAQTLSTLRDTLLPRLISGQLRLPEAQSQLEDALS